jgi:hypothetical protein
MHLKIRLLFATVALFTSLPVAAQSRVAVSALSSTSQPDTTFLINLPTARVEAAAPANLARAAFTGTGRYFIAVRENLQAPVILELWVVDLQTGAVRTQSLPGYNGAYVVGHPRLDEAYLVLVSGFTGTLAVVGPQGFETLRGCAPTPPVISRDGARVFCYDWTDRLVVMDAASRQTIRHFDVGGIGVLFTDATGATITVARADGFHEFDADTGALIRSIPLPLSAGLSYWGVFGDGHQAGGVFVQGNGTAGYETVLVDPVTLSARQRLPLPADRQVLTIEVLPDDRTALVSSVSGIRAVVDVIDLVGNQVTFSTTMFSAWQSAFLSVTSAPLAPVALSADVSGSHVRLSWQLPPASDGASAWRIEAGSLSGAADLAIIDPAGPHQVLEVNAVPAGRYYVRVRAINTNGISPASNEVIVDVLPGSR